MAGSAIKTHYRACNLCEAMCGIEIKHRDNKILSIKGDPLDSFSEGHICPKAVALKDLYEDPERLRKPIRRTGDTWQEIEWDEALDEVADNIKRIQAEHGRDAMALYLGNPNVHNMGTMLTIEHLIKSLRTANMFSATSVDQLPHHAVGRHLFGHMLRIPVPDIDNTDFMLILGGNPLASNGSIMTVPNVRERLKRVKKRGRVVVVDPRRSETADIASEHHFVKPGTDVLVLLAMLNTIFDEGLADTGATGKHIKNLHTDLAAIQQAIKPFDAAMAAKHSGMPAKDIRQLAIDFATADKPVCYGRMGVSVQQFGLLCQYLIMLINIVTGRLDAVGGMMFTSPAADVAKFSGKGGFGKKRSRVRGLKSFSKEFPVSTMVDEMVTPGDGQIKGLFTMAGNPVISTPNGAELDKALDDLDFMVTVDYYLNETNRHANIILPPVSPLEREHYDVIFHIFAVRNTARYAPALFEPPRDAMHDWQIILELQERLIPARNAAEKLRRTVLKKGGPKLLLATMIQAGEYAGKILNPLKRLSVSKLEKNPHGIDLGSLKPVLPAALMTGDKKIDLHTGFYLPDLERVAEQFATKKRNAKNKATLIGRRHIRSNNSWLHNSKRLVKGKPRCTVLMHPEQAAANEFADGQDIKIKSRVGEIIAALEISDEIMPGVVSVPHGWGHKYKGTQWSTASKHAGVSVNDLTDGMAIDELSGNAVLNGVPVTLRAA